MPQKFGLYEDLTVQENLDLYADLRGIMGQERRQSFERLLAFTDLASFTARPAGKLSGGMKQKLGLACVLLGRPGVLLLDEPSVGVDPISRRELWSMVNTLAAEGLSVVWSTSYLDEAERCRFILLMNAARLIYAGAPGQLAQRMQRRSVQICDARGNRRALLARALRAPEVIDGAIQGSRVRLVLRVAGQPPALATLGAGDGASLQVVAPRLEDAFIDLLGGGPQGVGTGAADAGRSPARCDRQRRHPHRAAHQALRPIHRGRRMFSGPAGGDLRPAGSEWRRQIHHLQDALRPAGAHQRPRQVIGIDLTRTRPGRASRSATWRRNSRSTAI